MLFVICFKTDKNWRLSDCASSGNTTQSPIRVLEAKFGFPRSMTIHSPRNFYATCARQLLYAKAQRNTLGRWAEDSEVSNRYDRGVCATELRLRDDIPNRIEKGWRPAPAFEVPDMSIGGGPVQDMVESSASSTSDPPTPTSERNRRIEDITQLYD